MNQLRFCGRTMAENAGGSKISDFEMQKMSH